MWSLVFCIVVSCVCTSLAQTGNYADLCRRQCVAGDPRCVLSYPGDCQKYITCELSDQGFIPTTGQCAFGTFFGGTPKRCNYPDKVNCEDDLCRNKMNGFRYKNTEGCRSYWECKNGVSEGKCCKEGMYYEIGSSGCVDDNSVEPVCNVASDRDCALSSKCTQHKASNESCRAYYHCNIDEGRYQKMCCNMGSRFEENSTECKQKPNCDEHCSFSGTDGCPLHSVPNDVTKKKFTYAGSVMECGYGVIFSEDICACIHDPKGHDCMPKFDFSRDYQNDRNLAMDEITGNALFGVNNSYMEIHSFENSLRSDTMLFKIKFNPSSTSGRIQVLISSCDGFSPIEVILNPDPIMPSINTTARSKSGNTTSVFNRYLPNADNTLRILYRNNELSVVNEFNNMLMGIQSTELKGLSLSMWKRPMYVGMCETPRATYDSYEGNIQLLEIYNECVPKSYTSTGDLTNV